MDMESISNKCLTLLAVSEKDPAVALEARSELAFRKAMDKAMTGADPVAITKQHTDHTRDCFCDRCHAKHHWPIWKRA